MFSPTRQIFESVCLRSHRSVDGISVCGGPNPCKSPINSLPVIWVKNQDKRFSAGYTREDSIQTDGQTEHSVGRSPAFQTIAFMEQMRALYKEGLPHKEHYGLHCVKLGIELRRGFRKFNSDDFFEDDDKEIENSPVPQYAFTGCVGSALPSKSTCEHKSVNGLEEASNVVFQAVVADYDRFWSVAQTGFMNASRSVSTVSSTFPHERRGPKIALSRGTWSQQQIKPKSLKHDMGHKTHRSKCRQSLGCERGWTMERLGRWYKTSGISVAGTRYGTDEVISRRTLDRWNMTWGTLGAEGRWDATMDMGSLGWINGSRSGHWYMA